MALTPNALLTLAEARDFLGAGAEAEAKVEAVLNRTSELLEAYCDRPLKRTAALGPVTVRRSGASSCLLAIDAKPIDLAEAVIVTVDGLAQTVWRTDADGDADLLDVVVGYTLNDVFHPGTPERALFRPDTLYRRRGWGASKLGGIALSYHGGLKTAPEDLKESAFLTVRKLFDDQQKNLGELVAVNTPSGGVTLYDRWIPSRAREILDMRYRRVTVG